MQTRKLFLLMGFIVAFSMILEIAAHADELNRETIISFSQPVQIPGQTLAAGTYVLKLADPNSDRNEVRIFNADRSKLYATIQTIPTLRAEPASDTLITLADQDNGSPEALLSWFYPGENQGLMFVYPKAMETHLAQATQHVFIGNHEVTSPSGNTAAGD